MGNVIANTVTADISGSTAVAADTITVDAEEKAPGTILALNTGTGNENTELGNAESSSSSDAPINLNANILAIMVSISGTGIVAVNGAFSGNVIADTVKATVFDSTVLAGVTGTKGNYSSTNSGAGVSVTTNTNSSIMALTVGVAGSGIEMCIRDSYWGIEYRRYARRVVGFTGGGHRRRDGYKQLRGGRLGGGEHPHLFDHDRAGERLRNG